MLSIKTLEFPADNWAISSVSTELESVPDGWRLRPGTDFGDLHLSFSPFLSSGIVGLEVGQNESFITIACCRIDDDGENCYRWDAVGNNWVKTNDNQPVFYSVEDLRAWLVKWPGRIRLIVRLTPNPTNPVLRTIRIGFYFASNLSNYLLVHGLQPQLSSIPVTLTRFIQSDAGGQTLEIPRDIARDRVISIHCLLPDSGMTTGSIYGETIYLDQQIGAGMMQVQFRYRVPAEITYGIHQITDVPVTLLYYGGRRNERHINAEDSIRMADGISKLWTATFQYDQEIVIEGVANTLLDAQSILDTLIAELRQKGYVYLPAYDLKMPVRVIKGVTTPAESLDSTNLYRVQAQILLADIIEGEIEQDVSTILSPVAPNIVAT